eukprot:1150494-Pelagomonas_calceolata.AAC.5
MLADATFLAITLCSTASVCCGDAKWLAGAYVYTCLRTRRAWVQARVRKQEGVHILAHRKGTCGAARGLAYPHLGAPEAAAAVEGKAADKWEIGRVYTGIGRVYTGIGSAHRNWQSVYRNGRLLVERLYEDIAGCSHNGGGEENTSKMRRFYRKQNATYKVIPTDGPL